MTDKIRSDCTPLRLAAVICCIVFSLSGAASAFWAWMPTPAGAAPAIPSASISIQKAPADECITTTAYITLNQPGLFDVVQLQSEESAFVASPLSGRVAQIVTSDGTKFYEGECSNWAANVSQARFGAVDIAGQFSGWSAWQTIK